VQQGAHVTRAGGARVLVVDDEPAIVRAVQTNLGRHDCRRAKLRLTKSLHWI